MGALNPIDIAKDNKGILLPVAGVLILILLLAIFYGQNGDLAGLGDLSGGSSTKQYSSAPAMQLEAGVDYKAIVETRYGDIEIDLYEDDAPNTVNNFVFLAKEGFYDGLLFHRVVGGFVIQGGDPQGDGSGGPGYTFDDEINPDSIGLDEKLVKDSSFLAALYDPYNPDAAPYSPSNLTAHGNDTLAEFYENVVGYQYDFSLSSHLFEPGVIAMANTLRPGSNGSQFFITVSGSETSSLNGRHTVFGRVVSGMDVVDDISEVLVDSASKPVSSIEIERITIVEE